MKVSETSSILETARSKIADNNTKDCLSFLYENLKFLDLKKPDFFRFRDEILHLQYRNSSLEEHRNRDLIPFSEYRTESSKLASSVINFFTRIEECLCSYPVLATPKHDNERYLAEVTRDKDFEGTPESDTKEWIEELGKIANIPFEELSILRKQAGSIILELALSTESIMKIKSLLVLEVVRELKDFKVLDSSWDWIEENKDFHIFLPKCNLSKVDWNDKNLSGADLSGADLSGADLSGADLSGADLRSANLRGVDFSGADFSGTDLRGADLRGADLSDAIFRSAIFSNADLSNADLSFHDIINNCTWKHPHLNEEGKLSMSEEKQKEDDQLAEKDTRTSLKNKAMELKSQSFNPKSGRELRED